VRIHGRVGIDGHQTLRGRHGLQFGVVAPGVGAKDLGLRGGRGFDTLHQIEQTAGEQAVADRGQAMRALRMTLAHVVAKETGMREVGDLHRGPGAHDGP